MQLAATQRAHPPPVPPRPSRQTVAEALKKTPTSSSSSRPPCPTRQAPPPPNQRPWRLEEQQQRLRNNGGGRTIVYESTIHPKVSTDNFQHGRSIVNVEIHNEEEKKKKNNGNVLVSPRDVGSKDKRQQQIVRPLAVNGKLMTTNNNIDETSKRQFLDGMENYNNNNNNNNVCNYNNKNNLKDNDNSPTIIDPDCGTSSSERKKKKVLNVTFKDDEDQVNNQKCPAKIECKTGGTTVVVIDKTEIISENNNDYDEVDDDDVRSFSSSSVSSNTEERDNIKRQDWLEAGVRYSSTKITLLAEEVAFVNGLKTKKQQQQHQKDHNEDEEEEEKEEENRKVQNQLEFADLDFSRYVTKENKWGGGRSRGARERKDV